jgi:hypothetical protein
LHQRLDDFRAGGIREALQFLKRFLGVADASTDREADEDGPFEFELLKLWWKLGDPPT